MPAQAGPPAAAAPPAARAGELEELVAHLAATTAMPEGVARRVVAEVVAFTSETLEEFVRRRHREMQAAGLTNARIFDTLVSEIPLHRFRAPDPSERQLRRIVYG